MLILFDDVMLTGCCYLHVVMDDDDQVAGQLKKTKMTRKEEVKIRLLAQGADGWLLLKYTRESTEAVGSSMGSRASAQEMERCGGSLGGCWHTQGGRVDGCTGCWRRVERGSRRRCWWMSHVEGKRGRRWRRYWRMQRGGTAVGSWLWPVVW